MHTPFLLIYTELLPHFHLFKFARYIYFAHHYVQVFCEDEDEPASSAEFNFLHYSCGYWDFPKKPDKKIVEVKYVFFGPCVPVETTKKGYKFAEDQDAQVRYKEIKKKNR